MRNAFAALSFAMGIVANWRMVRTCDRCSLMVAKVEGCQEPGWTGDTCKECHSKAFPYSVLFFYTHSDLENDDCSTGFDFATLAECHAFVANLSEAIKAYPFWDSSALILTHSHLMIDGPDHNEVIANHCFSKKVRRAHDQEDDHSWRNEIAMQAGMMGGCDAYNEAMGYD